jgi:predicted nucleic acid-binding protein
MLIDSDVFIWNWRGKLSAARELSQATPLQLSAVSYMELVQGMRSRAELRKLQADLSHWQATVLPVTQSICESAMKLVERHFLSNNLQLADALIAATALEHELVLTTGNAKHFRPVKGLKLRIFKAD